MHMFAITDKPITETPAHTQPAVLPVSCRRDPSFGCADISTAIQQRTVQRGNTTVRSHQKLCSHGGTAYSYCGTITIVVMTRVQGHIRRLKDKCANYSLSKLTSNLILP